MAHLLLARVQVVPNAVGTPPKHVVGSEALEHWAWIERAVLRRRVGGGRCCT